MGVRKKQYTKKDLERLAIVGAQPASEKEEKFLREFKTYEFINTEEQGVLNTCTYGGSNNHVVFTFMHGGKYKLPRHVARHIENCKTPIYEWQRDITGGRQKKLIGYNHRFQMREVFE